MKGKEEMASRCYVSGRDTEAPLNEDIVRVKSKYDGFNVYISCLNGASCATKRQSAD